MRLSLALLLVALLAPARSEAQCSIPRPDSAQGFSGYAYARGTASSFAGSKVRIWWSSAAPNAPDLTSTRGDGVPDVVAEAADIGDSALNFYAGLGYRPPRDDGATRTCAAGGGDALLDVYLVDFSAADGLAATERCSISNGAQLCSSFVLVKAKPGRPYYASVTQGLRTIVPHELFHAVQNAYDADLDRFWAEGTAQWATQQWDPSLRDLEANLPAYFHDADRPLDLPPGGATAGFLYGAAIWPVFLAQHLGNGVVRELLEEEGRAGDLTLVATEAVLTRDGESLATIFPTFALWNAATGSRTPLDLTAGGYVNADRYPLLVPTRLTVPGSAQGIGSGLGASYLSVPESTPVALAFEGDLGRVGAAFLPLESGRARLDLARDLPTVTSGPGLVVVAGRTRSKADAPWTVRASLPVPDAGPADAGAPDAGSIPDAGSEELPDSGAPVVVDAGVSVNPVEQEGCSQAGGAPASLLSGLLLLGLRRRRQYGF